MGVLLKYIKNNDISKNIKSGEAVEPIGDENCCAESRPETFSFNVSSLLVSFPSLVLYVFIVLYAVILRDYATILNNDFQLAMNVSSEIFSQGKIQWLGLVLLDVFPSLSALIPLFLFSVRFSDISSEIKSANQIFYIPLSIFIFVILYISYMWSIGSDVFGGFSGFLLKAVALVVMEAYMNRFTFPGMIISISLFAVFCGRRKGVGSVGGGDYPRLLKVIIRGAYLFIASFSVSILTGFLCFLYQIFRVGEVIFDSENVELLSSGIKNSIEYTFYATLISTFLVGFRCSLGWVYGIFRLISQSIYVGVSIAVLFIFPVISIVASEKTHGDDNRYGGKYVSTQCVYPRSGASSLPVPQPSDGKEYGIYGLVVKQTDKSIDMYVASRNDAAKEYMYDDKKLVKAHIAVSGDYEIFDIVNQDGYYEASFDNKKGFCVRDIKS